MRIGARRHPWVLLIVLILASPAAKVSAQDPAERVARSILAALGEMRWGQACPAWAAVNDTSCEPFRGESYTLRPVEVWCYRASDPQTAGVAYFHITDPNAEPPTCGLAEYHVVVHVNADMERLYPLMITHLTRTFGPPEIPTSVDGPGSYYWRGVRVWHYPGSELLLSEIAENKPGGMQVQVRARSEAHARRLETRRSARHIDDHVPVADIDSLLHAVLESTTPGLRLLGDSIDRTTVPRRELDALAALIDSVRVTDAQDRPWLLLLADRLTDRVARWTWYHPVDTLSTVQVLTELDAQGLELSWSPLGDAYHNPGMFLRQLWRTYPNTQAGVVTFTHLQRAGWDMSGVCAEGSDQFREVIRRGEEFLNERASEPPDVGVILTLALAYETWWSLSRASEEDVYVIAADYARGADDARRAAIRYYERVLASTVGPEVRAYAQEHVALLRLSVDPSQRAYYCIYD